MKHKKEPERNWNQSSVSWAIFGARMAAHHEDGFVFADLHKDNLAIGDSGDIVIIDYGEVDKILFPDEWDMLPTPLMSLLSWLHDKFTAAFRFGYLHHGGPIAKLVFDSLRADFGINCFQGLGEFSYTPLPFNREEYPPDKVNQLAHTWKQRRINLPLGDIAEGSLNVEDLTRWRDKRDKEKLRGDFEGDEYHYNKHLIAALAQGSLCHFLEALLNLQALYFTKQDLWKAAGFARFCQHLITTFSDRISNEIKKQVQYINRPSLYPPQVEDDLKQLPEIENIFRWRWCLDDYSLGSLSSDRAT